jgi:hypothetical protein
MSSIQPRKKSLALGGAQPVEMELWAASDYGTAPETALALTLMLIDVTIRSTNGQNVKLSLYQPPE